MANIIFIKIKNVTLNNIGIVNNKINYLYLHDGIIYKFLYSIFHLYIHIYIYLYFCYY